MVSCTAFASTVHHIGWRGQQVCFAQEARTGPRHFLITSLTDRPARNPDNVPARHNLPQLQAHRLTQPPFDPISLDCIAHPSADRETKTADLKPVWQHAQHKQFIGIRTTLLPNLCKALIAAHAVTAVHDHTCRAGQPASGRPSPPVESCFNRCTARPV